MCDRHNQSDIILLNNEDDDDDDEDYVNREVNLRIIWGTEMIRIPLRQVRITLDVYS